MNPQRIPITPAADWHCDMPEVLGALKVLCLWLQRNKVTGSLPDSLCRASGTLADLDVSQNVLSGALPEGLGLGGLQALRLLIIFMNRLTSTLPRGLAGLRLLDYLQALRNSFEGALPDGVKNLRALTVF